MKKESNKNNYRKVAFKDSSSNNIFLINSTVETNEVIDFEGKEYPLFSVDISSASHPFYTGNKTSIKATGRVERFNRMFKK